jgi:hypothetical protein
MVRVLLYNKGGVRNADQDQTALSNAPGGADPDGWTCAQTPADGNHRSTWKTLHFWANALTQIDRGDVLEYLRKRNSCPIDQTFKAACGSTSGPTPRQSSQLELEFSMGTLRTVGKIVGLKKEKKCAMMVLRVCAATVWV